MKISDEAIEAFRLCLEIDAAGLDDVGEEQGGRLGEYLEAHTVLGRALGLKPWQASPADVPDQGECTDENTGSSWASSWAQAQELRRELLLAAVKTKAK